jgi:hypothetical protein
MGFSPCGPPFIGLANDPAFFRSLFGRIAGDASGLRQVLIKALQ